MALSLAAMCRRGSIIRALFPLLNRRTLNAETLRVSAIPDEAPTELIRKFKPLGEYLEQQLGMPVKFTPVSDYAAVVESLASDRLDLAWLGGFTFVQTRPKSNRWPT